VVAESEEEDEAGDPLNIKLVVRLGEEKKSYVIKKTQPLEVMPGLQTLFPLPNIDGLLLAIWLPLCWWNLF